MGLLLSDAFQNGSSSFRYLIVTLYYLKQNKKFQNHRWTSSQLKAFVFLCEDTAFLVICVMLEGPKGIK